MRIVEMSSIMVDRRKWQSAHIMYVGRRNKGFKNKINTLNQAYISSDGTFAPKKSHRTNYKLDLKYLFYFYVNYVFLRSNMSKGYHFLL